MLGLGLGLNKNTGALNKPLLQQIPNAVAGLGLGTDGYKIIVSDATNDEFYSMSYTYKFLSTIPTVEHSHGTNIKAQTNDNTANIELLSRVTDDLLIKIKELEDRIIELEP